MEMISPCPRYSPRGINCPKLPPGEQLDYSLSSPLANNQELCKHNKPWPTPAATWTAGQQVSVKFAPGGAPHGGGHCQFSFLYDGGKKYVVVHEIMGHCFGADNNQRDISFTLPAGLPGAKQADFMVTWVNAIGNREFYCWSTNVAINGGSTPFTGKEVTIANWRTYPVIAEFQGNFNTGVEHYKNAKTITVG
ncbi:hypothetical protein GGF45_001073 [Coemansia sp. RSA 551]|nr:hypothetical protein GGF45_001073 [Coemansia sp. RSA 551]